MYSKDMMPGRLNKNRLSAIDTQIPLTPRSVNFRREQEAHQLVGQAKRCATKIRPKPSKAAFAVVFFSNFDKCRPEVADDVKSGVAV